MLELSTIMMPSHPYALSQMPWAANAPARPANLVKPATEARPSLLPQAVRQAAATNGHGQTQGRLAMLQEDQARRQKSAWPFPQPRPTVSKPAPKLSDVIYATGNFADYLDAKDAINLAVALPLAAPELLSQRTWRRSVAHVLHVDEVWLKQRAASLAGCSNRTFEAAAMNWQQLHHAMAANRRHVQHTPSLLHIDRSSLTILTYLTPHIVSEQVSNAMEHALLVERIVALLPRSASNMIGLCNQLLQFSGAVRCVILGAALSDQAYMAVSTQPLIKLEFIKNFQERLTAGLLNYVAPKTYRWFSILACGSAALVCLVNMVAIGARLRLDGRRVKDEYFHYLKQVNSNALCAIIETTKPDLRNDVNAQS